MSQERTPATLEFWDDFYVEGPGIRNYEWYLEQLGGEWKAELVQHLSEHDFVLHIGCGNSRLSTQVLESTELPQPAIIIDADYSVPALLFLKELQDSRQKKYKPHHPPEIMLVDVTRAPFRSGCIDVVLDKGCLGEPSALCS
jgi:hypothetical protein